MKKNLKFYIGAVIIVSAIIYLGVTGFNQDLSYYKTVEEVVAMGESAYDTNIRMAGHVVPGSIDRSSKMMAFEIRHNEHVIPVRYIGEGPVPDTFKDDCEAVVRGKYLRSGMFEAEIIQAKCASKYEVKITEAPVKS